MGESRKPLSHPCQVRILPGIVPSSGRRIPRSIPQLFQKLVNYPGVLATEQLIHDVHRRLLHIGQDVGVDAERDRDITMAHHLAHYLDVDARGEQKRGGSMPEIMKADVTTEASLR